MRKGLNRLLHVLVRYRSLAPRYTIRAKRGGSQSSYDSGGRKAQSAGAALRRYGEQALKEDARALLKEWEGPLKVRYAAIAGSFHRARPSLLFLVTRLSWATAARGVCVAGKPRIGQASPGQVAFFVSSCFWSVLDIRAGRCVPRIWYLDVFSNARPVSLLRVD